MSIVLFISFVLLIFLGTPVAIALGVGTILAMIQSGEFELIIFPHKMLNGVNSFTLVAVPLFIIAGRLAGETGLAKRMVKFASALVGHIPGGLGLVNVLASMFFGGISGSAAADTASVGGLIIPAMKEKGYDADYSGGITAASSTIGVLIPPSIPMVIYGLTVGVSISALFIGGLLPGILVGTLQMIVAYAISKKRKYPCGKRANLREVWDAFKESFLALLLPLIMLGGVGFGIATATEIGVIAVIYAFVLGVFVYKEYKLKEIPKLLIEAGIVNAVALSVVAVATVVSWIIAIEEVPLLLTNFLTTTVQNEAFVMIIINLFLLLVGTVMDLVPAMILFAPILLPIAQSVGISPIQFGAIMTINLSIGLVTPPVGTCLFLASGIAKVDIIKLFKAALPFLLVNIFVLILATAWKPLTMLLPSLISKF